MANLQALTCQCTTRNNGWTLDPSRNMWVCGACRLPSFHNQRYVKFCWGCEELFVIKRDIGKDLENCQECGGTNYA